MLPAKGITVVGFDPSLRNWGASKGILVPGTGLRLTEVDVFQAVLPTGKMVRQNSLDLESALQICTAAAAFAKGAQAIFVEVPHGSQSARAMASYGICVGILGALRTMGIPFIEVSADEVKLATVKKKTATKKDMINWAMDTHPEANWPMYTKGGVSVVSEAKAEHMADATAAIYAGVNTNSFKQALQLMNIAAN